MAEKLEIVVQARDQASAVLQGVAGKAKASLAAVGAAGNQAKAGLTSMGTAADGAGKKVGALGGQAKHAASDTVGAFNQMKFSASSYRAELGLGSIAMVGMGGIAIATASKFVKAAMEEAEAEDKLNAAIFATGKDISSEKLISLAVARQKVTRYSHEATQAMQAMLINMGFEEDQVVKLTPVVQDLSRAFGKDLNTSARMLGVTILKGVNTMSRMGIVIDKTTLQSGDLDAILRVVSSRVGGMAERMAGSPVDAMEIFKNEMGEIEEELGKGLLPALKGLIRIATPLAGSLASIAGSPIGQWAFTATAGIIALTTAMTAAGAIAPMFARGVMLATGGQLGAGLLARATGGAAAATVGQVGNLSAAAIAAPAAAAPGLATGLGIGGVARALGPVAAAGAIGYMGGKQLSFLNEDIERTADRIIAARHPAPASRPSTSRVGHPSADGLPAPIPETPQFKPLRPADYAQSLASQGWTQDKSGAWTAPAGAALGSTRPAPRVSPAAASQGVQIDMSQTPQGQELLIRVPIPADLSSQAGLLDDQTTAYLEDLAYEGDDF